MELHLLMYPLSTVPQEIVLIYTCPHFLLLFGIFAFAISHAPGLQLKQMTAKTVIRFGQLAHKKNATNRDLLIFVYRRNNHEHT